MLNFNVSLTYENDATSAIKKKLGEQDKNYIIKGYKGEGFFNANSLRITPQWRYLIKHSYLDSCVPFFIKGMTPNDDEYFANVVCRPLKQVYCYKGGQYNYLIKTDALSTNRQLYNFSNDFCYIDVFKYTYQFYKEHDLLDKLPVYDIGHIKGLVQGHIDKPHCYEKIRELFKEFYEVILFRQHLYSKDDINFVRSVMEYEKYSEWKQNSNSKEITKLFGVIPMLKVKKEGGKKKVWLFGIPILTTKIKK